MALTGDSGAVVGINAYDESGIPSTPVAGSFAYTGQAWVPELGLYHYKARFYSPTLGRFLQVDPVGYKDGLDDREMDKPHLEQDCSRLVSLLGFAWGLSITLFEG